METLKQTSTKQESEEDFSGKYLTFQLNKESYGIGTPRVKEIIRHVKITPVPQFPDFVDGVINLRDKVIPVVSLRTLFGMEKGELNSRTCIIVMEISSGSNEAVIMGLIVDEISEVMDISNEAIEPAKKVLSSIGNSFIKGIAKVDGEVKVLLNMDQALPKDEIDRLAAA